MPNENIEVEATYSSQWIPSNLSKENVAYLEVNSHIEMKTEMDDANTNANFIVEDELDNMYIKKGIETNLKYLEEENAYTKDIKVFSIIPVFKSSRSIKSSGIASIPCTQCDKMFMRAYNMRVHIDRVHHKLKLFQCEFCDKSFAVTSELKQHLSAHGMGTIHKCDDCGREFTNRDSIIFHRKKHNNELTHFCTTCGKGFFKSSCLQRHIRSHTGEKPYSCQSCGKAFTQAISVKKHNCNSLVNDSKIKIKRKIKSREKVSCPQCDKIFMRSYNMRLHIDRAHTEVKPFKCNFCDKAFPAASVLKQHISVHGMRKIHKCDREDCGKEFTNRDSAILHRKRHDNDLTHFCPTCNKGFYKSSCLQRHIRSHTGEKPYSCNFCGKRFSQSTSAKAHIKVCNGLIPDSKSIIKSEINSHAIATVPCPQCDKMFTRAHNMKLHLGKVHTEAKLFKCEFCDKSFNTRSDLKEHFSSHGTGNILKCEDCGIEFMQATSVEKHKMVCKAMEGAIEEASAVVGIIEDGIVVEEIMEESPTVEEAIEEGPEVKGVMEEDSDPLIQSNKLEQTELIS